MPNLELDLKVTNILIGAIELGRPTITIDPEGTYTVSRNRLLLEASKFPYFEIDLNFSF